MTTAEASGCATGADCPAGGRARGTAGGGEAGNGTGASEVIGAALAGRSLVAGSITGWAVGIPAGGDTGAAAGGIPEFGGTIDSTWLAEPASAAPKEGASGVGAAAALALAPLAAPDGGTAGTPSSVRDIVPGNAIWETTGPAVAVEAAGSPFAPATARPGRRATARALTPDAEGSGSGSAESTGWSSPSGAVKPGVSVCSIRRRRWSAKVCGPEGRGSPLTGALTPEPGTEDGGCPAADAGPIWSDRSEVTAAENAVEAGLNKSHLRGHDPGFLFDRNYRSAPVILSREDKKFAYGARTSRAVGRSVAIGTVTPPAAPWPGWFFLPQAAKIVRAIRSQSGLFWMASAVC